MENQKETTGFAMEASPAARASSEQKPVWTPPTLRVLAVSETSSGTFPDGPGEGTFYRVS